MYPLLVTASYAQVAIQQIVANDSIVPYQVGKTVFLKALDNNVTFTFRPVQGEAVMYHYWLSGYDRKWQSSPYPVARYTNLTGNEYQLLLRCQVNGRLSAITRIPVVVERELVEEWWFIPSVIVYIVLLMGAAIYFFLLYNFRQKLKVQSIRYRIAADLHDEVGATLSSISISTRLIQKKIGDTRPDVRSILDSIQADSEETIHTIRDTIWAINPDNDSLEKLFEKLRSSAFQVLTAQGIALDYENHVLFTQSPDISMEQRRNVYFIVKEAINNIAKHSGATKAAVQIRRTDEGIGLEISDNGVGFDTSTGYEGNGLKNFRSRAADSFMTLTIQSAPGQGTRIELLVTEI